VTSQADAIALYLESGHELTPMQALEMFGCFRLAARIKDLRARGLPIETLERTNGEKRFAAYRLSRPVQHTLFDLSVPTPASAVPVGERARSSSLTTDANI
jgi:hypothetical protein